MKKPGGNFTGRRKENPACMHVGRSRRDCDEESRCGELLNDAMKMGSEPPEYLLVIRWIGEVGIKNVNLARAMALRDSVLCFPGNPLRAWGIEKKDMIE
ncbi:MAG TPA: hypothetical protein PK250_18645 [Syntrophobacter fumaroxidans]|nr:hypothetical protein [Syntrophobacter fumaroxidans]